MNRRLLRCIARLGVLVFLTGPLVVAAHACPQASGDATAVVAAPCANHAQDAMKAKGCERHCVSNAQADAKPATMLASAPMTAVLFVTAAPTETPALSGLEALPPPGAPPASVRFCRFLI